MDREKLYEQRDILEKQIAQKQKDIEDLYTEKKRLQFRHRERRKDPYFSGYSQDSLLYHKMRIASLNHRKAQARLDLYYLGRELNKLTTTGVA